MQIDTSAGAVRGTRGEQAEVFWGIPYAEAPIGARRFALPQPRAPHAGVFEASQPPPAAPHVPTGIGAAIGLATEHQSEDCLHLSIWRPRGADAASALPVMVWVHGGGFEAGHAAHAMADAAQLAAQQSVVVVSVQYRLGVTGFLSLPGAPENRALHDVLLALRWVQRHIQSFGGDPAQVTLFGSSAGAIAVGALVASPLAPGLFARAVLQSGNLHCVHDAEAAATVRAQLWRELGEELTLEQLAALPIDALLGAQRASSDRLEGELVGTPFQPVWGDALLPRPPLLAIAGGAARSIELLVGANRDEASLLALRDLFEDDFTPAQLLAHGQRVLGCSAELAEQLLADVAPDARSLRHVGYQLATEVQFHWPTLQLLDAQRAAGGRAFAYVLARRGPGLDGAVGACHAMEIPLLFGTYREPLAASLIGDTDEVAQLSQQMQAAWAAFARHGDPGWPAYGEAGETMVFDAPSAVCAEPLRAVRRRWAPIWPRLRVVGLS